MIRFLQKDSRVVKAFFVVIIAAASVGMVVYLIPGLTGLGSTASDTYAVVYPHWYSRFFSSGEAVSQTRVNQVARREMQAQRLPDSPFIVNYFMQRAGTELVQQAIETAEAEKLGIYATDDDVLQFLHKGQFGEIIFPNGVPITYDRYSDFVARQFNMSVAEFEDEVKRSIQVRRLQALITAGVTVSDQEVRADYRKRNIKIKFDYAIISSDELRKTINPSDSDLEGFFKRSAARYATAVPEERKITYFAFLPNEIPGGLPQPSQQEIQQYFTAHQSEYQTQDQARSRHILIKVAPGADAKTDAAAKAKAEDLLKQIQGGANFADLAKKNSDDPGSKENGGLYADADPSGWVPEFGAAARTQTIGKVGAPVKTQFGYHLMKVESRKPSRLVPFEEAKQEAERRAQQERQSVVWNELMDGLRKEIPFEVIKPAPAPKVAEPVKSPEPAKAAEGAKGGAQ